MALQPGGIESGGIGHGEAVDGTRIDLGGVADPRGVQHMVEFAESGGREIGCGVAEVDLRGDRAEAVGAVGGHGGVECGQGGYPAGVGGRGARRQEAADAVAGDRDRTGRRSEEHRVAYPCAA